MLFAVFADIHANRQAFSACLDFARARGAERVICLGDYVGYGADPEWTVETVMGLVDSGAMAVRGNHDNALGLGVDCGCRGDFRELSVSTRAWHRTLVHEDDLALLRTLPCFTSPTTPTTSSLTKCSKIFPTAFCFGQNVWAIVWLMTARNVYFFTTAFVSSSVFAGITSRMNFAVSS